MNQEIPKGNIPEQEKWNYPRILLGEAFREKNLEKLRFAVNYIQNMVQSTGLKCSPMTDGQLKELLETGRIIIGVGSGTLGQRIFIRDGEIYMPFFSDDAFADMSKKYNFNFRDLFGLPHDDDTRPGVKF